MPDQVFFLLGICLLLAHEMDAVRVGEWKMFPVLSRLQEEAGYLVFTALHIPIYALLFWGLSRGGGVNFRVILGLDVFLVVHVFLHLVFVGRPTNRFVSAFSWLLILGAGLFGATDALTMLRPANS